MTSLSCISANFQCSFVADKERVTTIFQSSSFACCYIMIQLRHNNWRLPLIITDLKQLSSLLLLLRHVHTTFPYAPTHSSYKNPNELSLLHCHVVSHFLSEPIFHIHILSVARFHIFFPHNLLHSRLSLVLLMQCFTLFVLIACYCATQNNASVSMFKSLLLVNFQLRIMIFQLSDRFPKPMI